jgi:DNA adenine methylase
MSTLSVVRADSPLSTGESERVWSPGYPGSKGGAGVSEKLISLMPRHRTYVAGFAGHDAIYWRKKKAERTTVIDVDGAVIQWWRDRAPDVQAVQGDFLALAMRPRRHQLNALLRNDTLLYLDPPYLREVRSDDRQMWLCEMDSPEEHAKLLRIAMDLPCMVMISGYWSGLYEDLLSKGAHLPDAGDEVRMGDTGRVWRSVTYTVTTRGGTREELCWMNFPEGMELHDTSYAGWDYRQRERIKKKRQRWVRRLLAMSAEERQAIFEDCQTACTIAAAEQMRGEISDPPPPAPAVTAGKSGMAQLATALATLPESLSSTTTDGDDAGEQGAIEMPADQGAIDRTPPAMAVVGMILLLLALFAGRAQAALPASWPAEWSAYLYGAPSYDSTSIDATWRELSGEYQSQIEAGVILHGEPKPGGTMYAHVIGNAGDFDLGDWRQIDQSFCLSREGAGGSLSMFVAVDDPAAGFTTPCPAGAPVPEPAALLLITPLLLLAGRKMVRP